MPNKDGINTAFHPNRQVGGHRWTENSGSMYAADDYEGDGWTNEMSVVPSGRDHGTFMAHYERSRPGAYGPDAPNEVEASAGPFRTPYRGQVAASALMNRHAP